MLCGLYRKLHVLESRDHLAAEKKEMLTSFFSHSIMSNCQLSFFPPLSLIVLNEHIQRYVAIIPVIDQASPSQQETTNVPHHLVTDHQVVLS